MNTIALVCATDRNFALGATVMLYSAIVHLPRDTSVRVFIFDIGLDEPTRARMTYALQRPGVPVAIEWVAPRGGSTGAQAPSPGHRASYARLDVAAALPPNLERVIYLDSDMLVLADLTDLYLADMGGRALMAVQDYHISSASALVDGTAHERSASDTGYFNAGLLVIDLQHWRELDLGRQAIERLRGHRLQRGPEVGGDGLSRFVVLNYGDQDALNAVAVDHWVELDLRWNVSTFALRNPERICEPVRRRLECSLDTLRREVRIVHYCGLKPWDRMVLEPLSWRWWRYCRQSGWFHPVRALFEQARWAVRTVWRVAGSVVMRAWHRGLNA